MYIKIRICISFILSTFLLTNLYSQALIESKFISKVSQKNLQKNVWELVKCGHRMGGTKSGDNAVKLIYKKFKSYGFNPEIITEPEKLTYSYIRWKLKIEEPKSLRGLIKNEWLANYSPSVARDTARVTFVNLDDNIDEEKIKGKAILVNFVPTQDFYEDLVEAGAKCILSYINEGINNFSNYATISNLKESDANKIPLFNISSLSGNRLKRELEKGVSVLLVYSSETIIKMGSPKTVIATLKGLSDEYIIVCAHGDSDSGGPGADDNASGVSGVLEVARILNSLVKSGKLPLPKYTIKFIIWGMEYYSATNYVKQNSKDLEKIRAVINVDEIGYGKTRSCVYFEGNDISHNQNLLRLFEKIGEDYVDRKGFWKEATTTPVQGGTDSYVFFPKYLDRLDLKVVEIPSITVFTTAWNVPKSILQTKGWTSKAWKGHPDSVVIDYSPYYHSSLDIPPLTTDKEPANMVWAVNAIGIALIRLLWAGE